MTSALELIALITILSRTLTRVQSVFLAAALVTQFKLITALFKSLRSFVPER